MYRRHFELWLRLFAPFGRKPLRVFGYGQGHSLISYVHTHNSFQSGVYPQSAKNCQMWGNMYWLLKYPMAVGPS